VAIYKNMDIKIIDGNAQFNEKFYVYQNDRGIELHLKLKLFNTNFGSSKSRLLFSDNSIFVGATVLKPNGDIIGVSRTRLVDDIIRFKIDEDLTNDIDEVGFYKIQFHLYDDKDNRITIPPVTFEVKELIGITDDIPDPAVVDSAIVDFTTVVNDENSIQFIANGKYIKTEWIGGDIITASKLNKIEDALESLDNKLNEIDSNDIKGGYYQVNSIEERNEIPEIKRREGMLCYVKNDKIYQLLNGVANENWTIFYSNSRNIYIGEEVPQEDDAFVWIDISDTDVIFENLSRI